MGREKLGLNDPVWVQYGRWLEHALHGDFGISYKYKMDAVDVIGGRIGNTLLLGGVGFALVLCSPCCWDSCARGMRTKRWTASSARPGRS